MKQKRLDDFNMLMKDDDLILSDNEFKDILSIMSRHNENYAYRLSMKYNKFYHDCIVKTKNFIPFDENDYRIGERIYCLLNNISHIPACKYCNRDSYYINRKVGYTSSCTKCSKIKNADTRFAVHVKQFN